MGRAYGTLIIYYFDYNGLKPVATILVEPMALSCLSKIAMGFKPIANY
jgi:hypothetical protein